jgi:hypothetical protein
MKIIPIFYSFIFLLSVFSLFSCKPENDTSLFRNAVIVPVKGNSWIEGNIELNDVMVTDAGITGWTNPNTVIKTYFRTEKTGEVRIAIVGKAGSGKSEIECSLAGQKHVISLSSNEYDTIVVSKFTIEKPGYNSFDLKGISKKGETFGTVSSILIDADSSCGRIWYVKDDFYWGRRGPSVHLRYNIPEGTGDIKWFYNEITIPEGNDVIGSYFMADGFTDGYFGMQVNSETERRFLFSVWSPYKTDNPGEIPEDFKIVLLKKGDDVHAGEFGSEGSGGQSYLKYMWKAGTTYSFLLRGEPSPNNSTDYTAWFYAHENAKWQLIASFRRPKGSRYLGNLYSFLENFHTGTGNITRQGYYSNQWICDKTGKWSELTSVVFTADATARKESRLDYSGGVADGRFFLKNCGFYDEKTDIGTALSREPLGKHPEIDFSLLK